MSDYLAGWHAGVEAAAVAVLSVGGYSRGIAGKRVAWRAAARR